MSSTVEGGRVFKCVSEVFVIILTSFFLFFVDMWKDMMFIATSLGMLQPLGHRSTKRNSPSRAWDTPSPGRRCYNISYLLGVFTLRCVSLLEFGWGISQYSRALELCLPYAFRPSRTVLPRSRLQSINQICDKMLWKAKFDSNNMSVLCRPRCSPFEWLFPVRSSSIRILGSRRSLTR